MRERTVTFLNPRTCGIYKNGASRFKIDPATGKRTAEIDNELLADVDAYLVGEAPRGSVNVGWLDILSRRNLVPTYWDPRHSEPIADFLAKVGTKPVTIGSLLDSGLLEVHAGHGSPSNDQRKGNVPYIKVSDIRALRINVNPTNLVSEVVAQEYWGGPESGLQPWDVLTPNRASSNIGEFAILLPGEERVVLTKEVFIFRTTGDKSWTPFYLLWCLSLRCVREQWRKVALMQTNREDCGERYREVVLPQPKSPAWARDVSQPFKEYFETIALAKERFVGSTSRDVFEYVPTIYANAADEVADSDSEEPVP